MIGDVSATNGRNLHAEVNMAPITAHVINVQVACWLTRRQHPIDVSCHTHVQKKDNTEVSDQLHSNGISQWSSFILFA